MFNKVKTMSWITIIKIIALFLLTLPLFGCSLHSVTDHRDPKRTVESFVIGWGNKFPSADNELDSYNPSEKERRWTKGGL